jgi:chromosome partitioning protein
MARIKGCGAAGGQHRAKIIVMCSPKGGTGKTTFAENLLSLAAADGLKVVGVDFDPQETLLKWYARREEKVKTRPSLAMFDVASAGVREWQTVIADIHANGYDLAIIDLLPSVDDVMEQVHGICSEADIVLVTTAPTTNDMDSAGPWFAQMVKLGFHAVACINRANRREKALGEARAALNKIGPLCPIDVRSLSDAHAPQTDGMVAADKPKSETKTDFEAVWNYVAREIGLRTGRRVAKAAA